MTLSELCIRRPGMTTLITATIVAFGVFGFRLLPVSALPRVDFPTIAVTATWPGAGADTVAAGVAGITELHVPKFAGSPAVSPGWAQGRTATAFQSHFNHNIVPAVLVVHTAFKPADPGLRTKTMMPPSFRKV